VFLLKGVDAKRNMRHFWCRDVDIGDHPRAVSAIWYMGHIRAAVWGRLPVLRHSSDLTLILSQKLKGKELDDDTSLALDNITDWFIG